ncbi:MAG: O-methyltransferase [Actinomycetes bacterium]
MVADWARRKVEGVIQGSLRTPADEREDIRVTEMAVEAVLGTVDVAGLNEPARFARFLYNAFTPLVFTAEDVGGSFGQAPPDADNRFRTLVWALRKRVPAFSAAEAVRLGLVADRLMGDRAAAGSEVWAADVGLDLVRAASFSRKGRLLAHIVRVMRAAHVVEIGTSYGMSCLYLDSTLGEDGVIATVEVSRPQVPMATELFKSECRGAVKLVDGMFPDVLPKVLEHVPRIEFAFHDATHSGVAYVAHFEALEPHLVSGGTMLFDDIAWQDPVRGEQHGADNTHDGWRRVAAHPRVARAVEIDRAYGLLLLK